MTFANGFRGLRNASEHWNQSSEPTKMPSDAWPEGSDLGNWILSTSFMGSDHSRQSCDPNRVPSEPSAQGSEPSDQSNEVWKQSPMGVLQWSEGKNLARQAGPLGTEDSI